MSWDRWLLGAAIVPAAGFYVSRLRLRWWSPVVALVFIALLSTYRLEAVSKWIHDNSWWIGVENLTFSQAESERMNGLGTHLYFSTAGLRLKTYAEHEVRRALEALDVPEKTPAAAWGARRRISTSSSAKPGGATRMTRRPRSTRLSRLASSKPPPSRPSMAAPRPMRNSRC